MVNIIGNPLESTLAVSHLIFGGVLDRHPKLKFCVAHGAATWRATRREWTTAGRCGPTPARC